MRAFEIPEERGDQIAWLESEMVGTQLHSLVAELAAVHGAAEQSDAATLENRWSEATRDAVREQGFAALSDEQFVELLQHSRHLLLVQRDVLENGGRYWSDVAPPADLEFNSSFDVAPITVDTEATRPIKDRPTPSKPGASENSINSNILSAVVSSLVTAAALLLVLRGPAANSVAENPGTPPVNVVVDNSATQNEIEDQSGEAANEPLVTPPTQLAQSSDPAPAWGFAKFAAGVAAEADNLSPPLNRRSYLQELAKAADAWTNKRPDSPAALAQRLGEFRMGCSAILLAKHEPLPEADRAWLADRCRSWASALDRHLADVEAGRPVAQVRSEVDSTVTKIAAALLGRADTPTG